MSGRYGGITKYVPGDQLTCIDISMAEVNLRVETNKKFPLSEFRGGGKK